MLCVFFLGKWYICVVKEIDCSLVLVKFSIQNRTEWIYRGSSRLSPLYVEEKAAKDKMQFKQRATRSTTTNTNAVSVYFQFGYNFSVYIGTIT